MRPTNPRPPVSVHFYISYGLGLKLPLETHIAFVIRCMQVPCCGTGWPTIKQYILMRVMGIAEVNINARRGGWLARLRYH
jgi:hypothetical protein